MWRARGWPRRVRPTRASHASRWTSTLPGIRAGAADAVVVVSFLDRRLFPAVAEWLRPGGVLLWDTFLLEQRTIGHPRNPDFLLQPGELIERVRRDFDVLAAREGRVEEGGGPAFRAGVVARRRPARA